MMIEQRPCENYVSLFKNYITLSRKIGGNFASLKI